MVKIVLEDVEKPMSFDEMSTILEDVSSFVLFTFRAAQNTSICYRRHTVVFSKKFWKSVNPDLKVIQPKILTLMEKIFGKGKINSLLFFNIGGDLTYHPAIEVTQETELTDLSEDYTDPYDESLADTDPGLFDGTTRIWADTRVLVHNAVMLVLGKTKS